MVSNTETVVNPVDTPVDSMTRESATVEENWTLRHIASIRSSSSQVPISDPFFPLRYGPFDNCGAGPSTTRPQGMSFRNNPTVATTAPGAIEKLIDHGVVVVTDDQNTPNVTNNPLPSQNNLVGMICDEQEYKLLGKMGKLFRKIGEENKPIKSLEPVASLSVEGVNLDTKVLCVPGVSKGIEVRAGMPKLYPVQQLSITDSKVVPWNYNKIAVVYRGKEIVEEVDEAEGLTRSGRCYSPEELRKGKMTQNI
ncbi:hypothetical protein H5410_045027 [Solanum commersonii]|uniref:Uncharacterized protein n=1 Tax=Solanum commersonii TaxID=4109 RepID=A0A9J5X8F5_SOLCO|nr:hypothetical protein H5410_045027 [Solanum commersonii]